MLDTARSADGPNASASVGAERWARDLDDETRRVDLMAPEIRCMGCVSKLERILGETPGVKSARVNLTLRRIGVEYDPLVLTADAIVSEVETAGFRAKPFDPALVQFERLSIIDSPHIHNRPV